MFKKVEIWVLYLMTVIVFCSYILVGALVVREENNKVNGRIPKNIPVISSVSKFFYFLAYIPSNTYALLRKSKHRLLVKDRFTELDGFDGNPLTYEAYFLLSRHDGELNEGVVELIDLKNFDILHKWNPDITKILNLTTKNDHFKNIEVDRDESVFRLFSPILFSDGSLIFHGNGSPLIKIDKNSNLLWIKDDVRYHHSIEKDMNGDFWTCVNYYPYRIDDKYVESNYNPSRDEGLRKLDAEGNIIFDKPLTEIFIENGLEDLIYGRGEKYPADPTHINDIQPASYDSKYWLEGDLFLSLRSLAMIIQYRPSENKIIWYKQGAFSQQHDVDILDDSRIYFFNNNVKFYSNGRRVDNNSEVMIYDFSNDSLYKYQNTAFIQNEIRTTTSGLSEILPDGSILVEETNSGRYLNITSDGNLKFTFLNRSKNGVYRVAWSRALYNKFDLNTVNKFKDEI